MEQLPSKLIEIYRSNNFLQDYWKWIAIVGLIIIILLIFTLNYLSILSLSEISSRFINFLSFQPPQITSSQPFQNKADQPPYFATQIDESLLQKCNIKKETNPLISDVRTIKNRVIGTLTGNINKLSYNQVSPSATLELISPKGEQTYGFSVQEEKGLVYDAVNLKDLLLGDLKLGQTIVASFNCSTRDKVPFRITRLSVTSL